MTFDSRVLVRTVKILGIGIAGGLGVSTFIALASTAFIMYVLAALMLGGVVYLAYITARSQIQAEDGLAELSRQLKDNR